jgi:hypothetical protein
MRLNLIAGIFFVLCIATVSATSDWTKYMKTNNNAGFQDATFSAQLPSVADVASLNRSVSTTGRQFQPLVADLDQDGENEIIGADGNYIRIWRMASTNTLQLEDELAMGTPQVSQGWVGDLDSDMSNGLEYVVAFGTDIYCIRYQDGYFNISLNVTLVSGTINSGITCIKDLIGDAYTDPACAFNAGGNGNSTMIYYPLQNVADMYTACGFANCTKTLNGVYISPAIGDTLGAGFTEFMFPVDANKNGNEGFRVMRFAGISWMVDNFGAGVQPASIEGILTYNINGGGDPEVCVSYSVDVDGIGLNAESYVRCYNSDGTLYAPEFRTTPAGGYSNLRSYSSPPVMCDIDGEGQLELCVHTIDTSSGPVSNITCLSVDTSPFSTKASYRDVSAGNINYYQGGAISCTNLDSDSKMDLIGTSGAYELLTGGNLNWYPYAATTILAPIKVISADLNNDNILEIIMQGPARTYLFSGNQTNGPPVLNDSLAHGGYLGYYQSPVCVDTAVTFTAAQVGANRNYMNDVDTDQERMSTDCGIPGASIGNGAYSLIAPSYTCVWNQTGTYLVDICLEDTVNHDLESGASCNTDSIIITVIDGVAGATCNLNPIISITQLPDGDDGGATVTITEQGDAIQEFMDYFTGANPMMKFIIAIMLIAGIMFAFSEVTDNGMVIVGAGMLMMVVCSVLKLISVWILMLLMCIFIFIFLIKNFIIDSSGD